MNTDTEKHDLPEIIPAHVAIIMDGNGRWAQARGQPRLAGHRAGTENLREIIEASAEFGIQHLTIYAFSTENWKRPPAEVRGLMRIFRNMLDRELQNLHENGVQLRHIGVLDQIDPELQTRVKDAVELTKNNTTLVLNVAFNYGGRNEIVHAVREIVRAGYSADEIDQETIQKYLYTSGSPDPDLIIRTSGEVRTSNFLIWQSVYSEWYFTPTLWPDFGREDLLEALQEFNNRDRRFGHVSLDEE